MRYFLLGCAVLFLCGSLHTAEIPTLGAQIWIEPGQTQGDIDQWFKTLSDLHMFITRLFIMWDVLEPAPDHWDFSLYDQAFKAAATYNIKIVASLAPTHAPVFRGGVPATQHDEMPGTRAMLDQQKLYSSQVVKRYQGHPALYAWMQQNEPGRPHNTGPGTIHRYRKWLQDKYKSIDSLNAVWRHDYRSFQNINYNPDWERYGWMDPDPWYDWREFGQEHLTWYMQWIADEIRKHDPDTPLHLNPHGLVGNLIFSNYELHTWRDMLHSLGASIHVAWHFGMLKRIQYTMGVSYVCDLIRGASEPNPFWVTELQGGNNIYSAVRLLNWRAQGKSRRMEHARLSGTSDSASYPGIENRPHPRGKPDIFSGCTAAAVPFSQPLH
ncbi:MAG: beta-galactosidase [candidate division KSB1 bacterium]|nr:beta-galactosidase [candidate division KSB1 bacterium]